MAWMCTGILHDGLSLRLVLWGTNMGTIRESAKVGIFHYAIIVRHTETLYRSLVYIAGYVMKHARRKLRTINTVGESCSLRCSRQTAGDLSGSMNNILRRVHVITHGYCYRVGEPQYMSH